LPHHYFQIASHFASNSLPNSCQLLLINSIQHPTYQPIIKAWYRASLHKREDEWAKKISVLSIDKRNPQPDAVVGREALWRVLLLIRSDLFVWGLAFLWSPICNFLGSF
jgi:hypothetical protein